jgi:glycosyltransferase involved in cell wall biosynthesis
MPDLAVIILTYNEEIHLARALDCIAGIAQEIFVIDSFSTDRTVAIAEERGAYVLQHAFVNHAKQFQWALDNAPITANWVMRLDADEVIEPDLAVEIKEKLPILPDDVVGINLKRKHIFMGRWIKYGGRYPLLLLRIWRRGRGHIEDRWMDEHMVVTGGRIIIFNGAFADWNLNDLSYFVRKHDKYASREALDVINQRRNFSPRAVRLSSQSSSRQASLKRFIKEGLFNHVPFQISAPLYFLMRYFFQLGFLDRREGLIYHFLQAYWYRFLVGAKILEIERAIGHLEHHEDIKAELSRVTGLHVS